MPQSCCKSRLAHMFQRCVCVLCVLEWRVNLLLTGTVSWDLCVTMATTADKEHGKRLMRHSRKWGHQCEGDTISLLVMVPGCWSLTFWHNIYSGYYEVKICKVFKYQANAISKVANKCSYSLCYAGYKFSSL